MLFVRVALGLLLGYGLLVLLGWLFQERLAFPAPRGAVPDPKRLGIAHGERIELALEDGTRLAGWYLPPAAPDGLGPPPPTLLWFYGNAENIARIAPLLIAFKPPVAALLVVDYPGYGGSGGKATEQALYAAADAAYGAAAARADGGPIFAYGRSLGSAVATYTAANHPVAGLILESPFASAAAMARLHYRAMPRSVLRLRLDNVAMIRRVRCPVLILHGTADRLAPVSMGKAVAEAAPGPVELVLIPDAGHNDTYEVGGTAYRDKVWEFMSGRGR